MDTSTDARIIDNFVEYLRKRMRSDMKIMARKKLSEDFLKLEENKHLGWSLDFFIKTVPRWNTIVFTLIKSHFLWLDKARIFRMTATPVLDPELKKIFKQECKITLDDDQQITYIVSNDGKGNVEGNYGIKKSTVGLEKAQALAVEEYWRLNGDDDDNDEQQVDEIDLDQQETDDGIEENTGNDTPHLSSSISSLMLTLETFANRLGYHSEQVGNMFKNIAMIANAIGHGESSEEMMPIEFVQQSFEHFFRKMTQSSLSSDFSLMSVFDVLCAFDTTWKDFSFLKELPVFTFADKYADDVQNKFIDSTILAKNLQILVNAVYSEKPLSFDFNDEKVKKQNEEPQANKGKTSNKDSGLSTELGNSVANVEEMDGRPPAKRTKTEYEKSGLSTGFSTGRNKLDSSRVPFETLFCQETKRPINGASIPCYDTESLFKSQICIPCGIVCQNRSSNVKTWRAAFEKLNLNPWLFTSQVPAYRDEEKKMWAIANVESTYIINRRLYKISELPQLESCKIEMIENIQMKTKTAYFYEFNTLFSDGRWSQEIWEKNKEEQPANTDKDSVTQKVNNISPGVYYCVETQKQISEEHVPCYTREDILKNKICVPCGIVYQTREIHSKKKDAVRRSIFEKKNLKPELFQSQTTKLSEYQKQYWRVSDASYSSGRYFFSWRLYEAGCLPYLVNFETKIIEQFQMELKTAQFKEWNYIYDREWEQNFSKVKKDEELAIQDEA